MRTLPIVFTRHALTEAQRDAIQAAHPDQEPFVSAMAGQTLANKADARQVLQEWSLGTETHARDTIVVYGVIPPILRATIQAGEEAEKGRGEYVRIQTYEAHNVNRAPEGDRPQFEFVRWLKTGDYVLPV